MKKETALLRLKNVSKFYYSKGIVASGFNRVSLEFNMGEFVVITGESGSGKSTLLNVLSGLDTYEEGEMYINGEETSHYNESDFEHYRKTYIGNIFQSFNLVNSYTVYQNIELVLLLNGYNSKDIHNKIMDLIRQVDLYRFRNTRVSRLSGGQKQRVAIARALAKDTPIIIADEPTGNLDSKSAKAVLKLLKNIAKDKLVIIVTHNYDQVEEYATRKIEMHDGKVREDLKLKEYVKTTAKLIDFKDITFINKFKLALRNSFNIFSKFALIFIVFLFVILAFLGEYASFRKFEYEESLYGYNDFFSNLDDKRIIIKKKDMSNISESDFQKINAIDDVDSIEKHDVLLDQYMFNIESDSFYFWGNFSNISEVKAVDMGRLPQNENEIVIKGSKYDYSLTDEPTLFDELFSITKNNGFPLTQNNLKIVGIILEDTYDHQTQFYVTQDLFNDMASRTYDSFAKIAITINGNVHYLQPYDTFLYPIPNKNVKDGEVIVSSGINYLCKYENCLNQSLIINSETIYNKKQINFKISNLYNKNNFKNILGLNKPLNYDGEIYISYNDYNQLFNDDIYQSSVFVNKSVNVDRVNAKLNQLGYQTYLIRDMKVQDASEVLAVIRIFKVIVTIVLFIVLFFIAYFVIRLIQKSKNVYYSTVRILGGSRKVINNLIRMELLIIFNITFIISMLLVYLVKSQIITNSYISNLCDYLIFKDYIIIYLVLLFMSLLIAMRYSRKLFKTSAMKAYTEEV